jgi:Bacterial Ig-like domain (group 2)
MNRSSLVLLGAAALAACVDLGVPHGVASLSVQPVLDSVFVGDRTLAHRVTYIDENGNVQPAGTVVWTSTDTTIATINAQTGAVTGVRRGSVVIIGSAHGITGPALIVVSDTLDITLHLDTMYLLPGDTLSVPVTVLKRTPVPAAAVWFTAPSNAQFSIDSASGRITATATAGGPSRYIVHADSLADTGAVYVMSLSDTTGGKMFLSVSGTVITHVGASAVAVNYRATSGKLAFQLRGRYAPSGTTLQLVEITLPDSVIRADTTFAIDSLNPGEDQSNASGFVAECSPPRPWAFWSATNRIISYSRPGGTLSALRIVSIPNGQAVSGHFHFTSQRTDLYTDPLGELSITGSFVVPLFISTTVCH